MIHSVEDVVGGALVKVTSDITGDASEVNVFGMTAQQVADKLNNNQNIQDAFPNLSSNDRELLITGISPKEWETLFGAPSYED